MTLAKRLAAVVLGLTVLGGLAAPARAEIRGGTFKSAALGRDVAYVADLPPGYDTSGRTYPLVVALHGLFESSAFWERRGLAAAFAAMREKGEFPEAVVIAVDGGNSFFVNAPGGRYQDLVTEDLLAWAPTAFRVKTSREGRVLFGISMGGYAALRIAFARPDLFRAVATHSAMLLEKIPSPEDGAGKYHMAAFQKVFGDPIDAKLWTDSDPLALSAQADAKSAPALYFDCGSEDRYGLFVGNEDLHKRLGARGVAHTFGLYPGDHGYEYVKSVLPRSLKFLGDALRP
jgi:S-formylglutathione hydrolase FrmB